MDLLVAPALLLLEDAKKVAVGVMVGGKVQTHMRRARTQVSRRIRDAVGRSPGPPEANNNLERALARAWVDVSRRWLADVEAQLLTGSSRPAVRNFLEIVDEHLSATDQASQDYQAPFESFLKPFMSELCSALDGRLKPDEERHRLRWIDHKIADAIWQECCAAYDAGRGRAGDFLSEADWADLQRVLYRPQEADKERLKYPSELMAEFVAKIKSGTDTEATNAFYAHAMGAILSQLDDLREEVRAGGDTDLWRLEAGMREQIDWVRFDISRILEHVDELKALTREISQRMAARCHPIHLSVDQFYVGGTGFERLTYRNPEIPFVGRSEEIAALDDFLAAPGAFRWWIVTGPGGTGKSRLALEACIRAARDKGWDAGFVSTSHLQALDPGTLAQWQPEQPALLVVDYPSNVLAKTRDLLVHLADRANNNVAVRVLLLERTIDDFFVQSLIRQSSEGYRVWELYNWRSGDDGRGLEGHALVLGPLADPGDLYALGRAGYRIYHDQGELDGYLDAARFHDRHARIDPDRRAITALLIGCTATRTSAELTGILSTALDREVQQHWRREILDNADMAVGGPAMEQIQPWARRLLALATMVGGLDERALRDLDDARLVPPEGLRFPHRALRRVTRGLARTESESETRQLWPLRPEILGQFFALEALTWETDAAEGDAAWLCDLAWSLSPGNADNRAMELFCYNAALNFPDHPGTRVLLMREQDVVGWHHFRLRHFLKTSDRHEVALQSEIVELAQRARRDRSAGHALATALTLANDRRAGGVGAAEEVQQALLGLVRDMKDVHDGEAWLQVARAITNFTDRRTAMHPKRALRLLEALEPEARRQAERDVCSEWARALVNFIRERASLDTEACRRMIAVLETEAWKRHDALLNTYLAQARLAFISLCYHHGVEKEAASGEMAALIQQAHSAGRPDLAQRYKQEWERMSWPWEPNP